MSASPFLKVVGSVLRSGCTEMQPPAPGWAWGGAQPGWSRQGPCVYGSVLCVLLRWTLEGRDRGRLSDLSEFCFIPAPLASALPIVLRKGSGWARPPSAQRSRPEPLTFWLFMRLSSFACGSNIRIFSENCLFMCPLCSFSFRFYVFFFFFN